MRLCGRRVEPCVKARQQCFTGLGNAHLIALMTGLANRVPHAIPILMALNIIFSAPIIRQSMPTLQMPHAQFDLKQAVAAVQAGGIVAAELRAEYVSFFIVFELRGLGFAELVKSNGRERRAFRDPSAALKVIRELGIVDGSFSLADWDIQAPKAPAWKRPDQAAHMVERHRRAMESLALESGEDGGGQITRERASPDVPQVRRTKRSAGNDK
jgi:hypothetical protein